MQQKYQLRNERTSIAMADGDHTWRSSSPQMSIAMFENDVISGKTCFFGREKCKKLDFNYSISVGRLMPAWVTVFLQDGCETHLLSLHLAATVTFTL